MTEPIDVPALLARFDSEPARDEQEWFVRRALAETWAQLREAREQGSKMSARIDELLIAGEVSNQEYDQLEARLLASSKDVDSLHARLRNANGKFARVATDLRDMTDRYHEASGEADRLRDRIEHAGAYAAIQREIRAHHAAKREAAPKACFERPGGCSCWKGEVG
jgi:chromosome segregation ATPase